MPTLALMGGLLEGSGSMCSGLGACAEEDMSGGRKPPPNGACHPLVAAAAAAARVALPALLPYALHA